MDFHIRMASPEDYTGVSKLVSHIHHIHAEARPDIFAPFNNPMGTEYYARLLKDNRSEVIVAVDRSTDRQILAYSVLRIEHAPYRPIYQPRKYIFIEDFCVDEANQRQGVGREMFAFIARYAKEVSATSIELGVAEFNSGAIHFYESLGMQTRNRKMELWIEGG